MTPNKTEGPNRDKLMRLNTQMAKWSADPEAMEILSDFTGFVRDRWFLRGCVVGTVLSGAVFLVVGLVL